MAVTKSSMRMKGLGRTFGGPPPVPIEWLGAPAWRLPSGKALAEFALQAGFLAPLLLGDGPFWRRKRTPAERGTMIRREGGSEVR
jgi:hypothetical protein